MSPNELSLLLDSEKKFFADAFAQQASITEKEKIFFRKETVSERRERLSQLLFSKMEGRVAYGPFTGLELDPCPTWGKSDMSAKLLGCYELEILNALHSTEFSNRSHFVNVGAADGYFAVGCLRNGRFKTADCFEMNELSQKAIIRVAERNGVSKSIRVFGAVETNVPSVLKEIDWSDTVVLCDIEGAELDLFDRKLLDAINGAMILIEIHNWVENFWPRYSTLLKRASKNYNLRFLESSTIPTYQMSELQGMTDDNRMLILSEGRPNVMRYLQLISRSKTN